MAFSGLKKLVDQFNWPEELKKDSVDFFETLPSPLKAGVLGTWVALTWAGLKIGLIKQQSRDDNNAFAVREYDIFRLNVIDRAIKEEIFHWKVFHSIDADLKLYCSIISQKTSNLGPRSIDTVREEIHTEYRALIAKGINSRFPLFEVLTEKLHDKGYIFLLDSVKELLNMRNSGSIPTKIEEVIDRLYNIGKYEDALSWRKDIDLLCEEIKSHYNFIRKGIAFDQDNSDTLRHFVEIRFQGTETALRFCTAVFMAQRYLRLQSVSIPLGKIGYGDEVLGWLAEELTDGLTQRVVNMANDVIFAWIDVLAIMKDSSELEKAYAS